MERTLITIQNLSKLGRVLSKVVWICCIVGLVGCAVGIASLSIGTGEILKLGNISIKGLIETEAEMTVNGMIAAMTAAAVLCAFEIRLARQAENYFEHELQAGTPFTVEGALEMRRLGISAIVLPLVSIIVSAVVYAVMKELMDGVGELNLDNGGSIGLGIMFLVMSLICQYGAEREQK